jgi:hypothetical protein
MKNHLANFVERYIYIHIVRTAENRGLKPAFPIGWTAILLHHWSSVSWETIPFLSHSYWEKTYKTVESPDIFGGALCLQLFMRNVSISTLKSPYVWWIHNSNIQMIRQISQTMWLWVYHHNNMYWYIRYSLGYRISYHHNILWYNPYYIYIP